ncbi:hypothetical protein RUND412_008335 [Rhizina undulata]
MRVNFITALLFATALARAAPAPVPAADAIATTTADDYDQDSGLEARDALSDFTNFEPEPTATIEFDELNDHEKRAATKQKKPKTPSKGKLTPGTKTKVGKKPAKTTAAAACKLKSKKGAKGKVSGRAINEGCDGTRNVYRIRMTNMHAKAGIPAEEQDHCGIFVGDENDNDNHGTLYHTRFMSSKEAAAAGHPGVTDMYKYERKELKKGLASQTARPAGLQDKIGTISSVAQLKKLETAMAGVSKKFGTQEEGYYCQDWTNSAVETIKTESLVDGFKQPSNLRSTAADNKLLDAKWTS